MSDEFRCSYTVCQDREPFKNAAGLRMHQIRAHGVKSKRSKKAENGGKQSNVDDAVLTLLGENAGRVITRRQIIDGVRDRGVQQNPRSLATAVTKFLREHPHVVDRVARGQYIAKSNANMPAPQLVAVEHESPEVVLFERDHLRARVQQLQEIVMRLVMVK